MNKSKKITINLVINIILYIIGTIILSYFVSKNIGTKNFIKYALILLSFIISILGIIIVSNQINIPKEYRLLHHNHITFLIIETILLLSTYICIYIYCYLKNITVNTTITESIISIILIIYFIYKEIYYIYYNYQKNKYNKIKISNIPKQYYQKEDNYYIKNKYSILSKIFKYSSMLVSLIIIIYLFIIYYKYKLEYLETLEKLFNYYLIIPIILHELYLYFDGEIEENKEPSKRKIKILWEELEREYHRLWKKQLLGRYKVTNNYQYEIIDNTINVNDVSKTISSSISNNKTNDFLYSRILSPITEGKDIIIESYLLETFTDIIVPIINIMFSASKRIMFICDNYQTVSYCEKWLENMNILSNDTNSKIVVDILNYNQNKSIKLDSKVDIYISTVDLALNSKAVFENIDVIFGINIDKIISDSALNLNLLASVLSNNQYNNVQYILFTNRVNEITQTVSQVLMRNNFIYQVINNAAEKNFYANFWSTEKGWLQSSILPGYASHYLGQLIPLSLPAFKYNVKHVDIISSNQASKDQMLSLQTTQSILKKYMNKDIVNLDEAITFLDNENFLQIKEDSVIVVGDTSNNAALMLLNYLKYTKKNMYLNIVSNPYLLRDYIVSNIDFFISNVDAIGNILPVPKSNIKLSVYKLINKLCYGYVLEENLLREIKNQETDIKIDTFENDQVRFVTETLQALTKKAFGINIFFSSYLTSEKVGTEKRLENRRYYKLLDSIKNELPEHLFKNITFIDSEQSAKILKRIPVFELYQNYLEGQYISFEGKYYLIEKIDYDNGIVDLRYSSNTHSVKYRQNRQINNIKHECISKYLPSSTVRNTTIKKHILCASLDVNTNGYYEFNNNISFVPGQYSYKEINTSKKGLTRKYKSTNILVVNITNQKILNMNELDKFKLSFTISLLLNELFETLFSNIKQYILVRNVIPNSEIYKEYNNQELIKLYNPIIDSNTDEGINIYITEDTELEKGITDTIASSFDSIILRLLYDYLYWLLKEDNKENKDKWLTSINGDRINIENIDKLSFLKYGFDNLPEYLDLASVFNCLDELILSGNDTLTFSRTEFINKRVEKEISKEKISSKNKIKIEPKHKTFKEKLSSFFKIKPSKNTVKK